MLILLRGWPQKETTGLASLPCDAVGHQRSKSRARSEKRENLQLQVEVLHESRIPGIVRVLGSCEQDNSLSHTDDSENQEQGKRVRGFELRQGCLSSWSIRIEDSEPDFLQRMLSKMRCDGNKEHRYSKQFAKCAKPKPKLLDALPFIKIVVAGHYFESRQAGARVRRHRQDFDVEIVVTRFAQKSPEIGSLGHAIVGRSIPVGSGDRLSTDRSESPGAQHASLAAIRATAIRKLDLNGEIGFDVDFEVACMNVAGASVTGMSRGTRVRVFTQ